MCRAAGSGNAPIGDFGQRRPQAKPGAPEEIRDDPAGARDGFMEAFGSRPQVPETSFAGGRRDGPAGGDA